MVVAEEVPTALSQGSASVYLQDGNLPLAAGIIQLAVIPEAGIQGTLAAISGFGNH